MKRFLLAALIGCCLVVPAHGQVKLVWKMADGQQLTTTIGIESQQTLTLNGTDINTSSTQQRVLKHTAGKRSPDGKITVVTEVESLKANLSLPGGVTIDFDSEKESRDGEGPYRVLTELLKLTSKIKYSATYDADHRVSEVQLSQDLLKDLDDTARGLIGSQLDTEAIKATLNEELTGVPDREIAPGEDWVESKKMRLEAGQVLEIKTESTYQGTVREQGKLLDKITTKAREVKYEMDPNSVSPLKPKSSDLQVEDQGGVILFDRELGQVVKKESNLHITGSIVFSANGTDLPADLDLRLKTKTQTTE